MLPHGPDTRIIVPHNVEILAFLASFRAILTVFWADFAPLGPFGAFWTLFRGVAGNVTFTVLYPGQSVTDQDTLPANDRVVVRE